MALERSGFGDPPGLQRPAHPPVVSASGSWAHPIAEPEPGCLLLARLDNLQFFTQAVILVTSHGEAPRWGGAGSWGRLCG